MSVAEEFCHLPCADRLGAPCFTCHVGAASGSAAQVLWKWLLTVAMTVLHHAWVHSPLQRERSCLAVGGSENQATSTAQKKAALPFTRQIIGHGKSMENISALVLYMTDQNLPDATTEVLDFSNYSVSCQQTGNLFWLP